MSQGSSSTDSSNNSVQSQNRYDVFISFRGPDTRNNFVDHLYAHLTRKGLFAFKDDTRLEQGESISPQLLGAINNSRVAIVVFSTNYASSTWCLDEMAAIADCGTKSKQIVFPVFYDVDPSDVRKQNGVYENAFLLHTQQPYSSKVDRWRSTMTSLAELAGWDVRNKPEFEEIDKIVQGVIKKLGHIFSGHADDLIGIQPRVEELQNLLNISSKVGGSRVLGILGMDGIGKTTLATVLYDRISCKFEACCFIENVSQIYRDGGAIRVQKQIIEQSLKEKNLEAHTPSEISGIVKSRLHNLRLLLVLDNVDQIEQLQELHISPKLLHPESRIIITTRDEHILKVYGVDTSYKAQLMNDNDARDLLCRKAFHSDHSSSAFDGLIPEVLKYAQGLPLAIRVMGSFLCTRNVMQWTAALKGLQDGLQNILPDHMRIMKVLEISFEGLATQQKDIFLHVACFFKGEREEYVRRILDACGLNPDIGIPLLVEKSLITIRNQEIHMHGMLQELGKEIVRRGHHDEPEFWTRLWLHEDFHRVMMMTETAAIKAKAIVLDQKEDGLNFNELRAENLSKMKHLKLLILHHKNFSGTPLFLSNSLRYLFWHGYPFDCLPSKFQLDYLVELNMPDSSLVQLWTGIQQLPYLKIMDLSNSKNLEVTPCFSGMLKLERLDLAGCISLRHVDRTIGLLKKLKFLSLQNCSSLVRLDFGDESKLRSLRVMRLSGCTQLKSTPDFTGALNLEYLDMDQCKCLSTIPIGGLPRLKFLSLRDCTNLVRLPLVRIRILSSPLPCLIFLDLSFCNISEVPDAIGELSCLERLNLQGNNFSSVPSTIGRLSSLAYLNLSHCHMLEKVPNLPTKSFQIGGKYFETTSGSRNHRSGVYIFDCPKIKMAVDNDIHDQKTYLKTLFDDCFNNIFEEEDIVFEHIAFKWLKRLVEEPRHFRCGFDIVLPWLTEYIPMWFPHRQFKQGSIIRIKDSFIHDQCVGFVFCVSFEVKNYCAVSSPLPCPLYLSFESEHTEECFDMPLNLELNKVDDSKYLWIIYISREHCHFVKTKAQITFKADQGLVVNKWGLRMLTEKDIRSYNIGHPSLDIKVPQEYHSSMVIGHLSLDIKFPHQYHSSMVIGHPSLDIDHVEESISNSFEPKIQLPYNWFVSDEDESKNEEAKRKEIDLFNQGLLTTA